MKAYTTLVCAGPFPSELFDDVGDEIQKVGAEFGATTGRRRRCGWLDTVILRNAVRLNGLTGLAITKLDVLDGLESVKICTGYEYHGEIIQDFPASLDVLAKCQPVYETLPGWKEDISSAKFIEEVVEAPVDIISTGPDRSETIVLRHPFG